MTKFYVSMSTRAFVSTVVLVEADSPQSAQLAAQQMAWDGNVEWSYDGVDEEDGLDISEPTLAGEHDA